MVNLSSYIGKTVYDLMMALNHPIDCYIIDDETDDYNYPTIAEFNKNLLTTEGHKKWDRVLKQYVIKGVSFADLVKTPFIRVESTKRGDYGEELEEFELCLAGYCSDKDWNKWFKYDEKLSGKKTPKPKKSCPFVLNFSKMI